MDTIPANHRLAERKLIALVRDGEWEINPDGSIWRVAMRRGGRHGVRLIPCARRRVEKKMPSGYLLVRAMRDGIRVTGLAHRFAIIPLTDRAMGGRLKRHPRN